MTGKNCEILGNGKMKWSDYIHLKRTINTLKLVIIKVTLKF